MAERLTSWRGPFAAVRNAAESPVGPEFHALISWGGGDHA